jgi:hypothetical protein
MVDVLASLSPKQVAAFYRRLANRTAAKAKADGLEMSLAATLLLRWLDNKPNEVFRFTPPEHLKSNPNVNEVLAFHRRVYLTDEEARFSDGSKTRMRWAGIIPRVQSGKWDGRGLLELYYESLVEIPLQKQLLGTDRERDVLYGLHGFQLRTDVVVSASPEAKTNLWKIKFKKFIAKAKDDYNWDYREHFTVPNPDYNSKAPGAVTPDAKQVKVYHSNALRVEDAGLAAPYKLESEAWNVQDSSITRDRTIEPKKRLR